MLGWNITVYRQYDGSSAAAENSKLGLRIASWQADVYGLNWVDSLVENGCIQSLGGSGYPNRYTGQTKYLIPKILNNPPMSNDVWIAGPDDELSEKWDGKTVIDKSVAAACSAEEWLLIEAWDLS
jgi:hypothetical protein